MSDIPINQVVNVNISISAGGAQDGDFGLACIWGDSTQITPSERVQSFSDILDVGSVFPSTTEEFKQAEIFFSQNPAPPELMIARWVKADVAGYLKTNNSTTALSSVIGIDDGSFKIAINGVSHDIVDLDLTSAVSWGNVATTLQAGIRAVASGGFTLATVVATQSVSGVRFTITSGTVGPSSTITLPIAVGTGTDLVALLSLGTGTPVSGYAAETAVQAIQATAAVDNRNFGMLFTNSLRDDPEVLEVAAYVQALPKLFLTVTSDANTPVPNNQTSLAYQSKQLDYSHTLFIYTPNDQYPDASAMSTMFTVNFLGANTVKNPKFRALPGISAVNLTAAQLNALEAVNCNTIISVKRIPFFSDGRMSGLEGNATYYLDTMHFQYWLQDYIQTNVFNLFLSKTVPYTDAGVQMEIQALANSLQQGVINGGLAALLGPNNTTIPAYTITQPPRVATVPLSQRAARTSPVLQFTAQCSSAINRVTINGTLTQ